MVAEDGTIGGGEGILGGLSGESTRWRPPRRIGEGFLAISSSLLPSSTTLILFFSSGSGECGDLRRRDPTGRDAGGGTIRGEGLLLLFIAPSCLLSRLLGDSSRFPLLVSTSPREKVHTSCAKMTNYYTYTCYLYLFNSTQHNNSGVSQPNTGTPPHKRRDKQ